MTRRSSLTQPKDASAKFIDKLNPKHWFIPTKHHWFFCHDDICASCLAPRSIVVPTYFYYRHSLSAKPVCKRAYKFLSQFKYLKVTDENAEFINNKALKKFMILRRKLNELFDLLHEKWFDEHISEVDEYKNLILKSCYITNEQISLLKAGKLNKAIEFTNNTLGVHLKTWPLCQPKEQICVHWEDDMRPIRLYEVDNYSKCKQCNNLVHKQCLSHHLRICKTPRLQPMDI